MPATAHARAPQIPTRPQSEWTSTSQPRTYLESRAVNNAPPPDKAHGVIYTIGYGGKGRQEFIEALKKLGIETIADVRMAPNRASMGMYVKAKTPQKGIQRMLGEAGIEYVWLEELGNPDREDPEMTLYRTVVWQELPQRTLRLVELATAKVTCLLCAEKDVHRCHRGIIGDFLRKAGWEVIDL